MSTLRGRSTFNNTPQTRARLQPEPNPGSSPATAKRRNVGPRARRPAKRLMRTAVFIMGFGAASLHLSANPAPGGFRHRAEPARNNARRRAAAPQRAVLGRSRHPCSPAPNYRPRQHRANCRSGETALPDTSGRVAGFGSDQSDYRRRNRSPPRRIPASVPAARRGLHATSQDPSRDSTRRHRRQTQRDPTRRRARHQTDLNRGRPRSPVQRRRLARPARHGAPSPAAHECRQRTRPARGLWPTSVRVPETRPKPLRRPARRYAVPSPVEQGCRSGRSRACPGSPKAAVCHAPP